MQSLNYIEFLAGKKESKTDIQPINASDIHPKLKPFQADVAEFLLGIGRGAAFLDTGLGKTIVQCEFARHAMEGGDVLIVAPLAVAAQTIEEAKHHLDMEITYSRDGSVTSPITITNYEMVHHFGHRQFNAVILDESSILKGATSKTRKQLIEQFKTTPYKLACTATPAPNDYTEIGYHAEFLGIMSQQEMLTRWFIHDSANTADWRLKGHAIKDFWQWVASWAACISKPGDLGYVDSEYDLPPLRIHTNIIETATESAYDDGLLFHMPTVSATDMHAAKRKTIEQRCQATADLVNGSDEPWAVWCESNAESEMLTRLIPDAVEVKGADSPTKKEESLLAFTHGKTRVIVSKPSICGFGMNWQHCHQTAFSSVSYSYEKFYQAVRRFYRFGQEKPVDVHVVIADTEIPIWRNVERKAVNHESMKDHMKYAVFSKGKGSEVKIDYKPKTVKFSSWL